MSARRKRMNLLEVCACQGGATAGYMRAGWTVTAVDMAKKHARYNPAPFYYVTDGLDFIRRYGHEYDAIHVSCPCQWYTRGNAKDRATGGGKWERTIPMFRDALLEAGRAYVLENVLDAAWDMIDPVLICACMFGMSVLDFSCTSPGEHPGVCDETNGVWVHLQRPRLFETNWGLTAPGVCEGEGRPRREHPSHEWVAGAYGGARRDKYEAKYVRKGGYVPPDKAVVKALLGIDHDMTWEGLFECVPPAYTAWIGAQIAAQVERVAA